MIAFFASREHHTQKLRTVFDEMSKSHDTIWVTCNNSINIDSPLEFLVPSREPFYHVYDRHIDPKTQKAIDRKAETTLRKLNKKNSHVAPFWLIHTAQEYAELSVLFDMFLDSHNVHGVVVLHNANFFARILSHVAMKKGVPVFSFQEGMLRERDQESFRKNTLSVDYSTKVFCWSKRDLLSLRESNPKANLVVGGLPHLDPIVRKPDSKRVYFAPTVAAEYKGNIQNDAAWIKSFCDQMGYEFLFKPHPFEKNEYSIQSYRGSTKDMLSDAGYIISQHSSIMVEAIALGVTVAEINRTPYPSTESLAEEAYALIHDEDSLAEFAENGFPNKKWANRQGYKVGDRAKYIVKEIEKCL